MRLIRNLACLLPILFTQPSSTLPNYHSSTDYQTQNQEVQYDGQDESSENQEINRTYRLSELIPGRVRLVTGLKRTVYC